MLVALNEIIFRLLKTNFYVVEFDDKIFQNLYKKNITKTEELKKLRVEINSVLNKKIRRN